MHLKFGYFLSLKLKLLGRKTQFEWHAFFYFRLLCHLAKIVSTFFWRGMMTIVQLQKREIEKKRNNIIHRDILHKHTRNCVR